MERMGLSVLAGSELPIFRSQLRSGCDGYGLATDPLMLLLDEVAAGLNPNGNGRMRNVIRWVHGDLNVTVFLIEHVMEMVMNLSHRVLVLEAGRLIAEGNPSRLYTTGSDQSLSG